MLYVLSLKIITALYLAELPAPDTPVVLTPIDQPNAPPEADVLAEIAADLVDPLLELAGLEKSHKTRIQISYLIAGLYLMMTFLIFWFRFNKGGEAPFNPLQGGCAPLTTPYPTE